MNFLYLYDLIDFDSNGNIKPTKRCSDEKIVASNFLYLICKYNQNILQEEAKKNGKKSILSAFFKQNLAPLLQKVESGEVSKEYALVIIARECSPKVREICENSINDAEIINSLNKIVSFSDLKFSQKVNGITNRKHQEYIMTKISGDLMDQITNLLAGNADEEDPVKIKSALYKKIISYNGIVNATMNLQTVMNR